MTGEALISNRGRVVARVTPVAEDERSDLDEFLEWIVDAEAVDTEWADEFARVKQADREAAAVKPWE